MTEGSHSIPYPVLRLQPKRERSVLNRHPWIFSGGLQGKVNATEGDIVEVRSNGNQVLGYGFFSAKSQISCRMFDWSSSPQQFETKEYWLQKFENALNLRKALLPLKTNSYRLLHAEGDFLPGLIIDVYNDVAVLQILIQGIEKIKGLLVNALNKLGFQNLYVKESSTSKIQEGQGRESEWLSGSGESPIAIVEHDLNFLVDYISGQKTGFFIDQRENRCLLKQVAKGKVVLNAFSYTGGFSVYALAGGAKEVYSLDISKEAVDLSAGNVLLNKFIGTHHTIVQDCFDYLKEMPENFYDIIVLDPPAFAKHARAVDNAAKGYKQINMKAIQKIKPGGLLFTFSCSQHISSELFQKILFGAAADVKRNVRIVQPLHQPSDHPVNIFHPEGEYLKGFMLWVE